MIYTCLSFHVTQSTFTPYDGTQQNAILLDETQRHIIQSDTTLPNTLLFSGTRLN